MRLRMNRYVCAFALACLFCGAYAWPQAGTGELTGIVTDATGAVIPGATVELINASTGTARSMVTSTAGVYRFVSLPVVGTYTLSVKQAGFKAVTVENIEISVGTTQTRDMRLEVGAPSETITVVGGAELVQTTESAVSTLIDRNIWQNMPLEVRTQNAFINLVAGAVPDDMAGSTRGAAVNGARGGAGNYMVEGVDNNDQGQAGRGQVSPSDPGGASTSISPDAIGEYRVITNSFAAEYGKAGGFVTDTVLKSGTNQWHGSLFEYNRIQALAAQHFFSNASGTEDSLVRNQFGGSFGGPIAKDKAFFFYSMEWHRMRQSEPLSGTSTTQQYLDWVNSGGLQQWAESDPDGICMVYNGAPCPGSFSNSATLGPIFSQLKQKGPFPLATSNLSNEGAGWNTGGLVYPVPVYGDAFVQDRTSINDYRISAKVDYALTNQDQISFIYLNQTALTHFGYGGGDVTFGPPTRQDARGQNAAITWNRTFSPTVANSFKMSFLRHRQDYPMTEGYEGIGSIWTIDPLNVGFGLSSALPQLFTDNQFQYQDHLSVIKGKHSFKGGAEYRRTRNGSSFFNDYSGTFIPYGVEDLVTDMAFDDEVDLALYGAAVYGSMYYASAAVDNTTGQRPDYYRGYRANEIAMYFQDDWRVSKRLTINMGLRYEYFGPPHNFRPGIDSNFYFGTTATPINTASTNPYFPINNKFYAGVATGTFQVRDNEIWNKDTNNFAPRVGFAWDVLGNQKLVLRAGAGVMYDRIYNNVFENIRFNPPYFSNNRIGTLANGIPSGALSTPGLYTVPFTSLDMFSSPTYAPKPNPRHMDQNVVSPYYQQFHLGLQWEFFKGWVVEPEYIATMGRKLLGYYDINTFNGRVSGNGSSTRINTGISADNYRNNSFWSNYHAMQITVRRNYAAGLGVNASYTWSRALDNISDVFYGRGGSAAYGGPVDTMNTRYDYGPADFHMQHRFVGTFSYELPVFRQNRYLGGWNINTIISLQSGVPFSPWSYNSDANMDGRYSDRVVYTGSGSPMDSATSAKSPADSYFDAAKWEEYTCPATINNGDWCNAPISRGTMIGPGYANVDFSIQKQFKITEGVKLSLLGNFFNFFNRSNFDLPADDFSDPSFGKSLATFAPRITQLAVRVDF